ncbi:MAG: ABC transporter ATP-binding protein [Oscillospiraceae bacterium]|nr:ABC transporter ATP-binding protein [Oscillospiraceae bacterium]
MTNVLTVRDLCKTYIIGKRQNNVLKNANFSMSEGEMVAVMGASGSGKSTLLYTVSGMDNPTAGSVTFWGKEIAKLKKNRIADVRLTEMGFIFQQMYMLKNLTVFDNIILPAYKTKNGTRKEKNEYAKELMKKMGIIEVADNDINEVSGGQLQRACICRSIINKPKMLFADEPTGSLNKQSSTEVMDEILRVNREGTAVLLVTHDVRVAAKSDRVLYISDGNIHGENTLGKYTGESTLKERERTLNNWLLDMGW